MKNHSGLAVTTQYDTDGQCELQARSVFKKHKGILSPEIGGRGKCDRVLSGLAVMALARNARDWGLIPQ